MVLFISLIRQPEWIVARADRCGVSGPWLDLPFHSLQATVSSTISPSSQQSSSLVGHQGIFGRQLRGHVPGLDTVSSCGPVVEMSQNFRSAKLSQPTVTNSRDLIKWWSARYRDLDQIRVGAARNCGPSIAVSFALIGPARDAPCRSRFLERFYLLQCRVEIIADIDDEHDGLSCGIEFKTGSSTPDAEARDAKTSSYSIPNEARPSLSNVHLASTRTVQ